jgi:hypothetical protein
MKGWDFDSKLVANAVIGGAASVAGGGSFANGAVTGAFAYLFNHAGHMLAGSDAHYQLLNYLQERDPGMWSGNVGFGGLFGGGRPDLIYDSSPYEVYEIKPDGADAAGAAQLARYLNTPGSNSIAGDAQRIFGGLSKFSLPGGWFGGTKAQELIPVW